MKQSNIFRIDRIRNPKNEDEYSYHIMWPSIPITKTAYKLVTNWSRDSHDYSAMSNETLMTVAKNIENKCKCSLTADQIRSIRSGAVKEKIIFGHKRMNENIVTISSEYNTRGILELSKKYDFPPLNLLRGIFIHKGVNKSLVYKLFNEKKTFDDVVELQRNNEVKEGLLTDRDYEQYQLAVENDAESTFNQQLIDQIAAENENIVVDYFKSLGIRITTQEQLVKEQIEEHGRAVLTPDILFIDIVYINGKLVKWIDYKDYAGTLIKFLRTSNIAQAKKYNDEWGTGALCYHQSFIDEMNIPGAILLDARTLPVKLKLYSQIYNPKTYNCVNGQGSQKKKGEDVEFVVDGYQNKSKK